MGQRKLDFGELTVDGGRSDALHGKKVGYMPQVRLKLNSKPFTFFLLHYSRTILHFTTVQWQFQHSAHFYNPYNPVLFGL